MSCYHPKKAFYVHDSNHNPEYTKNNKLKLYVTDYNVKYIYLDKNGNLHKSYDDFHTASAVDISDTYIQIPCGCCVGCRLDHSNMWSNRCMLEAQYHDSNYFVTLTYDDEHIPKTTYTDKETGEILSANTLVKRDWQLFAKRLRKKLDQDGRPKIRFFTSGEYGSNTLRPHMHSIIFGLELNDLEFLQRNSVGNNLYTSKFISDIWSNGFVTIGEVTPESCAYTARYCIKKAFSDKSVFLDHNMEPEFLLMSRKPGIGAQYFEERGLKIFDDEYIYLSTDKGGVKFKPPRYFEKLAEKQDERFFVKKKIWSEDNHVAEDYIQSKLKDTDLAYLEALQAEENNKISQIKALQRKL